MAPQISMPFAFLFATPAAALAAVAGAASIPIIIHLLNRKRYRIVTWAAMRFLLAAQKQNVRRMRLEQLILLAVRVLIIALLLAAMASVMPWAEAAWRQLFPNSSVLTQFGSRRTHKILVLDGSLSMALKVGEGNCFDRARAVANEILETSPGGNGFSVVLMAAPPQRIVPEASDDPHKVAEEIKALRLPHGNADLPATLNAVEDMLRNSPSKFEEREVYFLTDLQRTTWTARTGQNLAETLQRIQARARTILVDVGRDGVSNLAVTDLKLGVPLATTGNMIPITATVHHFGGDEAKSVRAELSIGKARAALNDPPFALRVVAQKMVQVQPGKDGVPVSFAHTFVTPGDYVLQVRIESDALEPDDVRSAVVSVKDAVPVLLVNGKPAVEVYDRATEWLRDALNPYQSGQVPRNIPARPEVISESKFADAGLGDLNPYDCVFLCDLDRVSLGEARRLETHLKRGGGVVFALGPRVDLEAYNRILYRNGEGILPAFLERLERSPDDHPYTLQADEEGFKPPPLDAFTSASDKASLLASRFRQYVQVQLPSRNQARKILSLIPEPRIPRSTRDGSPPPANTKMRAGDPAVVEWSRYRGRVVLLTSTANMDWNSWPLSPSYPAFMQELLRFAVAGRLREHAATVGDTLEEFLAVGSAGLDASVATPDGRTVEARTESQEDVAVLRFTETDQSGVYRATIGQHPQEYLFAVNVPTATVTQQATESDLARTNRDELQEAYPNWEFQLVTNLKDVTHTGGPSPEASQPIIQGIGRAIARILLLIFFVLLLAEVVLAWRFGHYTTAGPTGSIPATGRILPLAVMVVVGVAFCGLAGVLLHAARSGDFLGFLPETLRASVEQALGVPEPVAGEGTRWRLDYTPYLSSNPGSEPWLVGGIALLAVALVVSVYWHEGRTASGPYKILLAGVRICFVLLTLAVLLPQLRLWFERQGWPDVAIVIDDSKSMSFADQYRDPKVREAAERLMQVTSLPSSQRLQLAQALLTRSELNWLETLITRRKVKLHVYHCSGRAARLANITEPAEVDAAIRAVHELQAEGESSQLGTAVRQVLNDFRGSSLAAVVMLTDGVTTEGEDLPQAARYAAQTGVPLFFVGIGESQENRDLILHDLQVEDTVLVNDRLVFEARLTGQGYTSLTVPVTLYEKKDGKLKPLATQPVSVDPQGKPVKFRVVQQPKEVGEKVYVLEVPEQPDEVKPADNNRLERRVMVREAKPVRVLYVEGYPRYEYRFIKTLLERESADEKGNRTVDLHVLLLDSDDEYPEQDRTAVADFPLRDELNQYQVVILGDVDPKHPKLEKGLKDLADFVKERGGGLLFIAGERHSPNAFKNTPLREILPIDVTNLEPADAKEVIEEGFRPELTPVGRLHPIFRFSPDEGDNLQIWGQFPEVFWCAEGYRLQPAAEVLAVHPTRPAVDSRRGAGGDDRHPLVVQQFVGAGRCLFFGIDETWRWRYRENEVHFNQFWIQTIRYLARSRLGRIDLRLDRQTNYRRGEPIKVIVRFPDDSPPPNPNMEVKVVVERRPPRVAGQPTSSGELDVHTLKLAKLEGSRATYEALLTQTPEGDYRFWLSAPPGARPEAECRVVAPPGEMERLRMNNQDMEKAASQTGGRFYTLADADQLLDELPAGTRISLNTPRPPLLLWNHFAVCFLALSLVTTEWILRKRKHLL